MELFWTTTTVASLSVVFRVAARWPELTKTHREILKTRWHARQSKENVSERPIKTSPELTKKYVRFSSNSTTSYTKPSNGRAPTHKTTIPY